MDRSKTVLKLGTRTSRLSEIQTAFAVSEISCSLPGIEFETIPFSTPGDRDLATDLRQSPPDFFTRDLDDAILNGQIDCAIHSAKDMPDNCPEGIDWFWLPWKEDPRDVIVLHRGKNLDALLKEKDGKIKIGISSERRENYCRKRFHDSQILPIRGNIESRLAQLDEGKYDMLVMAAAALSRLKMNDRISEYIPFCEFRTPEGQGSLSITFRKGDEFFTALRQLFVHPAIFAGSGPGDPDLATLGTIEAIKHCDVCFYDALCSMEILKYMRENAEKIFVGKRNGRPSIAQGEISLLIAKHARQGKSVVRLKGGDPGIFGRLSEEIETLEDLSLPYKVLPGVSSLNSASTGTGFLLTRRGISRAFTVMTLRQAGDGKAVSEPDGEAKLFPHVFFMGVNELTEIKEYLLRKGHPGTEKIAIVLNAANPSQKIICSNLGDLDRYDLLTEKEKSMPGIIIAGKIADEKYAYRQFGALSGKKVLLSFSKALMDKAVSAVRNFGGHAIAMPMIELSPNHEIASVLRKLESYDWLTISSPSAVECLLAMMKKHRIDLRSLPKILTCGPGTSTVFNESGIIPDAEPEKSFSREGMIGTALKFLKPDDRILCLRSDKAVGSFAGELNTAGYKSVDDFILYKNNVIIYDRCPDFDAAVFGSASAVDAFIKNFGKEALEDKTIAAIGIKTELELKKLEIGNLAPCPIEASVESVIFSLAAFNLAFDL